MIPGTISIRPLNHDDVAAVSALHGLVFGPGRFARTAYRVREQRHAQNRLMSPFCRGAFAGDRIIASVTLTPVRIGPLREALLLGPLAVHPDYAGQGYGRGLVASALDAARTGGIKVVVLVGDESYYGRFGFQPVALGQIAFPGPVDRARILALELDGGALSATRGLIAAAA